ncbi:beta-citrylglutamate synthase B [Talpa occidentalis]|uniref:beta-citrylglutamate synthase B n=1 Tax=Talpa occidentalis TaxID=50954 RepID=UPI00188F9805|nr:beta-citrylglutamate synthase B [Talpa occidentalis]XP_037370282.1 beta-citrylglutamate synthase B [Talpa occidentalis]
MCSSVAAKLWFLTDRRIREDYPQKEILRALKTKCCEEELEFRAVVMDELVLTIEQGSLGLRINGELITAYPQVVVVRVPTPWVQSDSDITVLRHLEKMGCRLMNRPQAILNCVNKFWTFQELAGHGVPLPDTFSYGGHENFAKMIDEAEVLEFPMVVKNTRGHRGKAVFLARDKHHLADLSHLIRHEAPYLFQKYVKESHGRDVRVIVVGGRVVGTMLRCSTDGRMQSNCSLGGVGMMCSLSEQGKQLAIQVSNILGMDVCGIDLLMKDDGSFCVCEANANVGFIAFDKACNLDVAGIIADYAASLLPSGRLTRRMSLLSVVSTASETSEPELGPPASTAVDNMSASSSSVDSDPESTERELLTKLPGGLFNMNQLIANEIKLLVE